MRVLLSAFPCKTYYVLFGAVLCCTFLFAALITSDTAQAAQTVPYKINFQGRLTSSSGSALSDGSYNIRFRLYSESTAGTPIWTETREAGNRVEVKNGLFSLQLGEVTALSPSTFTTYPLYLEVELPTPATATCSTASCADWSEGAMTPRNPIGSSPQSMNSDRLDGLDSEAFAQVGANNTFTGTNIFKADSASAFGIQNSSGSSLLTADTTNMKVTVGSSTNGVALSNSGLQLTGSARSTKTVSLIPEYTGASFQGDGTNNNGSLSSDFCIANVNLSINSAACGTTTAERSYYQWTTAETTSQDYDIYVRHRLPADYDTGSMTNLMFEMQSTKTGQNIDIKMYNSDGAQCTPSISTTDLDSYVPEWITRYIADPLGSNCAALTAGQYVIFKLNLKADNGGIVRMGEISFTYRGKF